MKMGLDQRREKRKRDSISVAFRRISWRGWTKPQGTEEKLEK